MITTETVAVILAIGGLLPLLTSVVQQPRWSKSTRTWMAVSLSAVAGLVGYVSQFGLKVDTVSEIVVFLVGVILASATAYKTLWKPAGVTQAIEAATSPKAEVMEVVSTETQAVETATEEDYSK